MVILFVFIICFLLFYFIFIKKVHINFKSFFHKGFRAVRGNFGVYCFDGKQGSGKTYSVVQFLIENQDLPIYCNLKNLKGIKYTYFNGFDELLTLRDKTNCIIVYDELFTSITKDKHLQKEVLDFLSQMRKREIIFLTTAQEWLEINITFRRYCRYRIACSMNNFLGLFAICKRVYYDGEQIKWSQEENEYVAPIVATFLSKANLKIAQSYDTYEQINT